MMSLMQADTFQGEILDAEIDKIDDFLQSRDEDGFGCQANSGNDGLSGGNMVGEDAQADDDQFEFVANLNQQYEDAMQQRKFMKRMNRPRQNSL